VLSRNIDEGAIEALGRLATQFEEESREMCASLFQRLVIQGVDERRDWQWLTHQSDEFAALARHIAQRAEESSHLPAATRAAAFAHAIVLAGHASKRRMVSGQLPAEGAMLRLHGLLERAMALKLADQVVTVVACGELLEASAESLYARALLLARLASGCLSGRQIEILDDWLWAWMPALMLSHTATPEEPSLFADLDSPQGLNVCPRNARPLGKKLVFLPAAPLSRQVEHAVCWFQQGLIFPGFGLGATFRLEEHLGVIDYLTREFSHIVSSVDRRARHPVATGVDISVWFGFNDVATRGMRANSSTAATPRYALGEARLAAKPNAFPETSEFAAFDPAKKLAKVRDVSESGMGLAASEETARHLEVGDLVALQLDVDLPVFVGVLTRKAPLLVGDEVLLGVQFLSRRARALTLEQMQDSSGTKRAGAAAILIPGEHPSGFGDALLVSETAYRTQGTQADFLFKSGETQFAIRLGRIREQGRGWKMAAFTVARAPAPPAAPAVEPER